MNAEELQIGNIVCFATRPFVIDGISVGGGSVHSDKEGWQPTSEITPYPLTQEILEKNGFKNAGFFGKCEVGDWKILCDTKNVAIFHDGHTDIDIPIEYVHELQNALRLCGIDKEIVL